MSGIEVRQLEYFLAVHDHGGVTPAAKALHLSQPSLSQAIRGLERQLKAPLFHRVGRGLVLAPAGHALLEPARHVIRAVGRAESSVASVREMSGGRVGIAVAAGLVDDPLAPWLGCFSRRYPGVGARVEESENERGVAELVRSGACDLGLTSAGGSPEIDEEIVSEQHVVLVSPPGSPDGAEPVPLDTLVDTPMIVADRQGRLWTDIARTLGELGVTPTVVVEVQRTASAIPLVLAGVGATFLPLRLALGARARGAVVREIAPAQARRLRLLHRQGERSASATALAEVIRLDAGRWVDALRREQDAGLGLIAGAVAVDTRIRDARAAALAARAEARYAM